MPTPSRITYFPFFFLVNEILVFTTDTKKLINIKHKVLYFENPEIAVL